MNCADIGKKLKPFLEDLLADEDHKAFCVHIDMCSKCRAYVRSVGSLTNQLWRLGQVEVPEDLISTVQYKLVHQEEKNQPSKTKITKKQIISGIILIIFTIVLVLGISYFKKRRNSSTRDGAPFVRTEIIRTQEPPSESEAKVLLEKLETIAAKLGATAKDNTTATEAGQESPKD